MAQLATREPMAPRPMTPSVLPLISLPTNCFLPFSTLLAMSGVARKALRPLGGGGHIAAARDQHPDDQLSHGVGVGTGGVEDHDALLAAAVQRDVVHTGTGAGNGQQVLVEGGVQQVGAAHEDAVRRVGTHRDVEKVFVQLRQAHRADGVQAF